MRKLTATVIKTYCLKWLFVFVTFFIAFIAQAQLVQKWVVNNPVSLPTSALPTIKDAVVIGADGNIVVSGKNTLTKLNPAGGQIWTTALTAFPAGYSANSMAIALDNSDNIYLTVIRANINSNVFTGDEDIFVAKFNSAGVQQWSTWFDGPTGFRDEASGIAVDQWGNVYVTGSTQINPPSPYSKFLTVKYNTTGSLQWSVTYDGSNNSVANAIAVDFYTGEVYVCGRSLVTNNYNDFTTIKYNTNGGQEWIKLVNGNAPYTQDDEANAITVDLDGNVLVTGFLTSYYESDCCGDQDARVYQTFKYERITGNQIWRKGYGSKQSEGDNYFHSIALAIVTDGDENVIVTGYSELKSDGSKEWATIKYRALDGATMWVRRYNNAEYVQEDIFDDDNDVANSVAVDGDNNIYVSGYSKSNAGGYDYVTIKYNPATGADGGFARYDGDAGDKPSDIVVDWTGNVYVTGRSAGITTVKYSICSIICPSNISVFNTVNQCGAIVNYPAATTSGNCGSLAYSHASGSFFPVGITTDTVTSASTGEVCFFTITVVDNQNPTITCPAPVTVSCVANVPAINAASVTATDNCPGVIVSHVSDVITNQTCANRYTLTRTYKATDASGNNASCQQVIIVNDDQAPVISNASTSLTSLWPANHKMRDITLAYTITDNCTVASTQISITSNETGIVNGDGNTDPDWEIVDNYHIRLRAERSGTGTGRIYTITITTTDDCNAPTVATLQVVVAHNIKSPITGAPFKIGSTVELAGEFWNKPANTHTSKWQIDGSSTNGVVIEPAATKNGTVTGSYKFNTAGVYKLQMNVTDQTGITSYANTNGELDAIVVIYDPNGGYTYGGGWFQSPAGALVKDRTAKGNVSYGYTVNYYKGASKPKGETQFKFGDMEFNAVNFDYLAISGARAQFKGTGKIIGGQSGLGFIMTVIDGAIDGSGIDKVRMKIYNKTNGAVIYDNEPGASEAANPTVAIGINSSIVVQNTSGVASAARMGEVIETDKSLESQSLEITVQPNPSRSHFSLLIKTPDIKNRISIQVYDVTGKLIEIKSNLNAGALIDIGYAYKPGVYLLKAVQGKNHKELKLVKLSY